jgi:putative ABC transport system permease protein
VAVVGAFVARRLNGGYSMVGETIWIGRVPFEIVGQLAAKGLSGEGSNEDDQILIPLETAMRRLFNSDSLSRLLVQFASERQLGLARTSAREVLRASHELDEEARDDFRILSLVRQNEIRRRSSEFLQGLAATFAAVTLAVGAAGVLAVTFLNVKERIPEIGLRMAIGARPRDITRLFVAEACLLSAMGGLAGLLLGSLGIVLLARFLSWTMAVDLRGVAFPFAVSVMLGVTCSLIPAIRAASVMPVEALRDR